MNVRREFHVLLCFYLIISPLAVGIYGSVCNSANARGFRADSTNINVENDDQIGQNTLKVANSDLFPDDLVDGVRIETMESSAPVNRNINLNLNNSMKTVGLSVNVTDINETREHLSNPDFDSDVDKWQSPDETDVNLLWNSSYEERDGLAELKLSGEEQQHLFSRYNESGLLIDGMTSREDWYFENGTLPEDPKYHGYWSILRRWLGLSWCKGDSLPTDGYQRGYILSNFTYNGTENVVDADFSFDYNLIINPDSGWQDDMIADMNFSVFLVVPNGTEFRIGDWTKNIHANASTGGQMVSGSYSQGTHQSFNLSDMIGIEWKKGNYTLKFQSEHYHYHDGFVFGAISTECWIDNVKFTLNYTRKDFKEAQTVYVEQEFYFDRQPLDLSVLSLEILISQPFTRLNDSGAEIFLSINDNARITEKIDQITSNEWFRWSDSDFGELISTKTVSIKIGVNFSDSAVTFYPNNTWSLLLDNSSCVIKATPTLEQVDLSLQIPFFGEVFRFNQKPDGSGSFSLENGSITWFGNGEFFASSPDIGVKNYSIVFLSNSSETLIGYEIEKYGLSWRDTIIQELSSIKDSVNNYLDECKKTIISKSIPKSLIENLVDIVNYTSRGDAENALKYCSLISDQFPLMFKAMISSLEGEIYRNSYNEFADLTYFEDYSPIELLSVGNFVSVEDLFDQIMNLLEYFDYHDYSNLIMNAEFEGLYSNYKSSVMSKFSDIKQDLTDLTLTGEELSRLNLSSVYYTLNQIKLSVNQALHGMQASINIDPANVLGNWGCSDPISTLIFKNGFNGLFMGSLPFTGDLLAGLYNKSSTQLWKYSAFFEFITAESMGGDVQGTISNGIWPITGSLIDLKGLIQTHEFNDNAFRWTDSTDYSYQTYLSEHLYNSESISVGAEDLIYYYLLNLLIQDQIIRRNAPAVLQYASLSALSILEKTAIEVYGGAEHSNTSYEGDVQVDFLDTFDEEADTYVDLMVKNLGNQSRPRISQNYMIKTPKGYKTVFQHDIQMPFLLGNDKSFSLRVPVVAPDGIYHLNQWTNSFSYVNSSPIYYYEQEIFLGNSMVHRVMKPILYIPRSIDEQTDNKPKVASSMNVALLKAVKEYDINYQNQVVMVNVSNILKENNHYYDDLRSNVIDILLFQQKTRYGASIPFNITMEIGDKQFIYDGFSGTYFNDFASITANFDEIGSTGSLTINFDEFFEDIGVEANQNSFDRYVIWNITTLQPQYTHKLNASITNYQSNEIIPYERSNYMFYLTNNDEDPDILIQIPIAELSNAEYFKIVDVELTYNNRIFSGYNIYNPNTQVQGEFYTLYIELYPRDLSKIGPVALILDYTLKYYNSTEVYSTTTMTIEVYDIYHFAPSLPPNMFISILIASIIGLSALFIHRVFTKTYFLYKRRDFQNKKETRKNHNL